MEAEYFEDNRKGLTNQKRKVANVEQKKIFQKINQKQQHLSSTSEINIDCQQKISIDSQE